MTEMSASQADDAGFDCDVLVVGAGPVGLTLAMDLVSRGIACRVVESRAGAAPAHPKCNTVSARSMEIFRRLGCAGAVRRAGLPADYPCDVVYATRFLGHELGRVTIPSWSERFTSRDTAFDGGWPTAEPPHRISQLFLEPVLRAHAATQFGIRIGFGKTCVALEQDAKSVTATLRDTDIGAEQRVRARYVAGCDGSRSFVRRAIGVRLQGDDNLARRKSVYLRSAQLRSFLKGRPAWMTWLSNPVRGGVVVAIDGEALWLCHCRVAPNESLETLDTRAAVIDIVGRDFDFELLAVEDWTARRLVADRYRVGRVFVAGDAAHLWIPFAGFGMNAGIEDAAALGWMLAARLHSWAGEALLDAYELERRPIGEQISRAVAQMAADILNMPVPAAIEDDTPEGERLRAEFGRRVLATDGAQFNPVGLNFGTLYDTSPVVAHDGVPPPLVIDSYVPSTVPGCRAPDIALSEGARLHDRLGQEFTLVHAGHAEVAAAFARAALQAGLPLACLDIAEEAEALTLYGSHLVLVRPDQRVAWRGTQPPADIDGLLGLVRGARVPARQTAVA